MEAHAPDLTPAIAAVREYLSAHSRELTADHSECLLEIIRRLERMQRQAAALVEINNRLWAKEELDISFDSASDTVVVSFGDIMQRLKLNQADPNVPITMTNLTAGSGYHAGRDPALDQEEQDLRLALEEKLESYYQSGHRILKLFGRIPPLAIIQSAPITLVRNNLLEHPPTGALYSFGFGSAGPRLKPVHIGQLAFTDAGMVPNTQHFVASIVSGCTGS